MARKASGGQTFSNPSSQNANKNSEDPEISGGGLFFSYDEQQAMHLKGVTDWPESANSAYCPIMGGPAAGEENPFDVGIHNK